MSMFVQKCKEEILEVTHKFVNHTEIRMRSRRSKDDKQYLECELASSRLILYASNWLNHLAKENISVDRHAFYIGSDNVNECCEILERSPLYEKYPVFADIVAITKRLQRLHSSQATKSLPRMNFSLSG